MRVRIATLIMALASALCGVRAVAQQTVNAGPYMLQLTGNAKAIQARTPQVLDLFVMDGKTMAPISSLSVAASLDMPEMGGMDIPAPIVVPASQAGHYAISMKLPMAGKYELAIQLKAPTGSVQAATFELVVSNATASKGHGGPAEMLMKGTLGDWPMNREGSGTTWQPDSTPMYMKMLPKAGPYEVSLMGEIQSGYVDAGGKRGDNQLYANSMAMLMGRRETGGGILGLHFMMSLDPITNGKKGVPNLFQTGETYHGEPLVDRQHPHDLISEAAVSFSKPLGKDFRGFLYLAPVGEPAVGNVMFMHRASGMEVPEAPIGHHWFDSTHISFGVATLGITMQDKWKLEASAFNGHEPNENRFDIEPIQLNSAAGRISYNPDANWSFSTSYGYLNSPEALEPGVDQHRLTASATYSKPLAGGDNWSTSLLFGRNVRRTAKDSAAMTLESTLTKGSTSYFTRFETVDKDELVGVPAGSYPISKLLLGGTRNLSSSNGLELGIGAYVGLYDFPKSLEPYYGKNPTTLGVFLRFRPSKM